MTNCSRIFLCTLIVCMFVLASAANAANPIVVITNSTQPFNTYLPEIMKAEGMNAFDTADISAVTTGTLAGYDVAILGEMPLSAAQVTMFTTWVNGGGNLIVMRPDSQLQSLLGITGPSGTMADAYLLVDTGSKPGHGIVAQTIQYHGIADLYTLNGATAVATLYSSASSSTGNPAITSNTVGAGHAVAFSYDLARSVVYTRQGNPAWSGQERDGLGPIRSNDLYFGAKVGDVQPDWVDLTKVAIPQADEQQRLLVNIILSLNAAKTPIPHFWYLPKGLKAAIVMSGDDHATGGTGPQFDSFISQSTPGCSVADWECIRSTSYVYPGTPISNAATYQSDGFEIALHLNTGCNDFNSFADLDTYFQTQLTNWTTAFPSLAAPVSNRTHCVVWSDYDTQPQVELSHGIRFDANYYYFPDTWINDTPGLFTGSGMPMRFMSSSGSLIDVYQAPTQLTDESGQSYPYNAQTLIANALGPNGYFGVFTTNMHTDLNNFDARNWSTQIVNSAKAAGVPVVSAAQMLQWLDGRNSSTISIVSWNAVTKQLVFTLTPGSGARNLQAMLPADSNGSGLTSLLLGATPVTVTLETIKGVQFAAFAATAGTYTATYNSSLSFSLSGSVTPTSFAAGTQIAITGPVNTSTTVDQYGGYVFNGLPAGSYTVTPSKASYTFTPASRSVTLGPDNAQSVDFAYAANCPCSLWDNSIVPGTPSVDDPSEVELGVRFRSDIDGVITGIRFYKGLSNTGVHVGHLWTNSGELLSSVTFTGETASGWQQMNFTQPVVIKAGTTYVASYHTTKGNYAVDQSYFDTTFDNFPLHGLANGLDGNNGLFEYGATAFPTGTYLSSNYWVDVVLNGITGTRSISGTLSGPGAKGAVVTLSGAAAAATTSNASGAYTFSGLPDGVYTVTPSKPGFAFLPVSRSVNVTASSATGVDFGSEVGPFYDDFNRTLIGTSYQIPVGPYFDVPYMDGTTYGNNSPGKNTAAIIDPAAATFQQGQYARATLANISPNGVNSLYIRASLRPDNSDVDSGYEADFGQLSDLSGYWWEVYAIDPLTGFERLNTTFPTPVPIPNGSVVEFRAYGSTLELFVNGSSVWSTTHSGNFVGAPGVGITGDAKLDDFYAGSFVSTTPTFSIGGTITGPGANGAIVTLSGAGTGSVQANASGVYLFSGVPDGSYTVTVAKPGFVYSPTSQVALVNGANVTGIDFTSVVQTYTISGTISGPGGIGATVTLSGDGTGTTTADGSGNYTLPAVPNGAYTVTPSKTGYVFTPASQAVTVNLAPVANVNFSSAFYPTAATPYFDNFNRTTLGPDFVFPVGPYFAAPLLDGATFGASQAGMNSVALLAPAAGSFSQNQFARVKLTNVTIDGVTSLYLRANLLGDKTDIASGLEADFGKLYDGSGYWWAIYVYDPVTGFQTLDLTYPTAVNIPDGSIVEFSVTGTTLQLTVNGSVAWTGTYASTWDGTPGLGAYGDMVLDDFYAGNN